MFSTYPVQLLEEFSICFPDFLEKARCWKWGEEEGDGDGENNEEEH